MEGREGLVWPLTMGSEEGGRRKRQWRRREREREQKRDEVHGHKIAKGGIFTTTRCAVVAEEERRTATA